MFRLTNLLDISSVKWLQFFVIRWYVSPWYSEAIVWINPRNCEESMWIDPKETEHLNRNPGHLLGSTSKSPLIGYSCAPNPYSFPWTAFFQTITLPIWSCFFIFILRKYTFFYLQCLYGRRRIRTSMCNYWSAWGRRHWVQPRLRFCCPLVWMRWTCPPPFFLPDPPSSSEEKQERWRLSGVRPHRTKKKRWVLEEGWI